MVFKYITNYKEQLFHITVQYSRGWTMINEARQSFRFCLLSTVVIIILINAIKLREI
jgi:hypothetical protein